MGNDAGHEVEGVDALGPFFLAVDREGDALIEELDVRVAPALLERLVAHAPELFEEPSVVRTNLSCFDEHLVEEPARVVASGEEGLLLSHARTHESHRG